ncbi:VanZ family protein [Treponema parvum]|uniref:VanZ family protein n=1 Tax=Treponema parvum TaxID=138851 RepID=A0A975F149_9SPIR|nr:VanZ family protein [Treponema parvum]QTQ12559.1 VanZ family protein [Treponema parvum]QTQ15451.1 VanZ family protein [Treponema parvum]
MITQKHIDYVMRFMSCITAVAIFSLSAQEKLPLPGSILFPGSDKLLHAFAFGCFAFAFSYWLDRGKWAVNPHICVFIVCIAGAVYGVSDEIHQIFVPGRDASVYDWIADCAGTFSAALLRMRLTRRK